MKLFKQNDRSWDFYAEEDEEMEEEPV